MGSQDPLFCFHKVIKVNNLQTRIRNIVSKIIENTEFKIVDIDLKSTSGRYMLRVFLDSEKGIIIDRCREFSREIETVLDAENFLGENYLLEVSSPGLERPISQDWQFRKNMGRIIVMTYLSDQGDKTLEGTVVGVGDNNVTLRVQLAKKQTSDITIELSQIKQAKIKLKW